MCSLTLCNTGFVWCTQVLAQGSRRRIWERSYTLWPRGNGTSFDRQQRLPHPAAGGGFLRLLPALALVSLAWRQFGYWNWEKTNLTVNRILSCQVGELQQCGRGARAPSRQGGEACGRESGGGTQGQEEVEEAGSPPPKSFLLSCVTSPWDTEHWLHGSSISSCLLNKWVILRPSLSLKGTHINQIFFNRSFVVDTGAYLVHGKERPGSWLGLLGGTV